MNHELNSTERAIQFLYSIGLPPMRILRGLIILLVIGVVLAVLYSFNFKGNSTARTQEDSQPEARTSTKPTYDSELTLDQQIDELSYYDPGNSSYVVVYSDLHKQNERIEELRQESGLTTEQSEKLDRFQLRNQQVLVESTLNNGSSAETEIKTFKDFAESLTSSSNQKLKDAASYSITRISALSMVAHPTEANAESVNCAFREKQATFVNDRKRSEILLNLMLEAKQRNPRNSFVDGCMKCLGEAFANSDTEEIANMGGEIAEYSLFAHLRLPTLENRLRYQDRDSLSDLDNSLRVLEAHPEVGFAKWEQLFISYEATISSGRMRDFETARGIFGDLVSKLPDSDERKSRLLQLLERQKIRISKFGGPFDVTGETLNEKQIRPSSSEFTALVFLDRSPKSVKVMEEMMQQRAESASKFRVIVSFKNKFSEADLKKIDQIPPWAFVADDETSQNYLATFPIDAFPYIILVDKKNNIVAGNLSLDQTANRIATIEKRERQSPGSSLDFQTQ